MEGWFGKIQRTYGGEGGLQFQGTNEENVVQTPEGHPEGVEQEWALCVLFLLSQCQFPARPFIF